jgi:hypothetical protein
MPQALAEEILRVNPDVRAESATSTLGESLFSRDRVAEFQVASRNAGLP